MDAPKIQEAALFAGISGCLPRQRARPSGFSRCSADV